MFNKILINCKHCETIEISEDKFEHMVDGIDMGVRQGWSCPECGSIAVSNPYRVYYRYENTRMSMLKMERT